MNHPVVMNLLTVPTSEFYTGKISGTVVHRNRKYYGYVDGNRLSL